MSCLEIAYELPEHCATPSVANQAQCFRQLITSHMPRSLHPSPPSPCTNEGQPSQRKPMEACSLGIQISGHQHRIIASFIRSLLQVCCLPGGAVLLRPVGFPRHLLHLSLQFDELAAILAGHQPVPVLGNQRPCTVAAISSEARHDIRNMHAAFMHAQLKELLWVRQELCHDSVNVTTTGRCQGLFDNIAGTPVLRIVARPLLNDSAD